MLAKTLTLLDYTDRVQIAGHIGGSVGHVSPETERISYRAGHRLPDWQNRLECFRRKVLDTVLAASTCDDDLIVPPKKVGYLFPPDSNLFY